MINTDELLEEWQRELDNAAKCSGDNYVIALTKAVEVGDRLAAAITALCGEQDQEASWRAYWHKIADERSAEIIRLSQALEAAESRASAASEQVEKWEDISTLPDSNDLVWLCNGNTFEGPREPQLDDCDYWTHWCYAKPPALPIIQQAQEK